jgi:hypothetical protein
MIVRFRILLPFKFSIPEGSHLDAVEFEQPPYRVVIHPPLEAVLDTNPEFKGLQLPLIEVGHGIVPSDPQQLRDYIRMNGKPTLQANLLQIDVHNDYFDRRDNISPQDAPVTAAAFDVANSILRRIRSVTRAAGVFVLNSSDTSWSLEYLNDLGEELPAESGLVRRGYKVAISARLQGLATRIWEKVKSLPYGYEPPTWDTLLLDAELLLPHVGPVIVLAQSAIETAISGALNYLASRTPPPLPPGLWDWINERDDDYRKEPSLRERCGVLLGALGGVSLKKEERLWEAFSKIRKARNSFVHEGLALIDGARVTPKIAVQLLESAKEIVAFIENSLPPSQKRPEIPETFDWQITPFAAVIGSKPA